MRKKTEEGDGHVQDENKKCGDEKKEKKKSDGKQ